MALGFPKFDSFSGRSCNALWTFERFVDKELRTSIRETVRDVSKTDCEDLCLSENRFDCKSASYDHLRKECHLSEEDRYTAPESFVSKQGTDYLENQCQSGKCPVTSNHKLPIQNGSSFSAHIQAN